ncbi:MAG: 1,4-beta-xylanase [Promethearchaeota archaeon]|nr:MAG: 1,4-beta-xylanase [Candidatus Lokiarchaeota archaeon]
MKDKDYYLNDSFLEDLESRKWSIQRINNWYEKQPWFIGCNYIPSTAINQLEMFQEETFDPNRIDEELGWAESIGFNALRVFLHNLLWEDDSERLKQRIDSLLNICADHKMKVLFVLFDDMWNQKPKLGIQPDPIPGIHNSGWVASPGKRRLKRFEEFHVFEEYVSSIIDSFAHDSRIIGWDIYNEPGNMGIGKKSLPLVVAAISWAREVNPSQPITVGAFYDPLIIEVNKIALTQSDILSFHHYKNANETKELIKELQELKRPIFCTEYLSRNSGNLFETHLPLFKKHKIAAFNWGLVSGKTQTIYSWLSKKGDPEPEIWFHDIFREDGTPFSQKEVDFIKAIVKD